MKRTVIIFFILLNLLNFPPFSICFANPQQQSLPVQTYTQLLSSIRKTMAESRLRVEQAVEQEKVREVWEIGHLIDEHILLHKERADYAEYVMERLSKDLGISKSELYRMLKFARSYPIVAAPPQLSWAHYRELLSVTDEVQRRELTDQAVSEKWSHKRTRREVRRVQHRNVAPLKLERVQPGKIYTYRVVRAKLGPYKDKLVLDFGFSDYFYPATSLRLNENDVVRLSNGKIEKMKVPNEEILYTYSVFIEEIQDGDTFTALVDLGFGVTTLQILRLKGIDAREIESAEGMRAKKYLEKTLKNAPVLVRTVKSDKYDRYLADVFAGNRYLNQELVDRGLAVIVAE